MTSWPTLTLGELTEKTRPICYGVLKPGREDAHGVPLIRVTDIASNRFDPSGLIRISRSLDEEFSRSRLDGGEILISVQGTVGRVAIVPNSFVGSNISRTIALVAPDERVYRPFLYWYLRWLGSRDAFETVGTTRDSLNIATLRRVSVPLPPPNEQRRIADILDKADAIRRTRTEAISLTDQLLQSAFLEMVGPGATDYANWPMKAVEQLAAHVPNAMRTGPFGSDLRHSEFVNEGIAVLGIDNAVQNRFAWGERRYITQEKYNDLRRYTVRPGDVIVTIMGTTGRSAVVPDDIPTAITTKHLATITLDRDQAEPEFVSQALFRHPDVLQQIDSANRGAIMSGLNLGLIKALQVAVPPVDRQREFADLTRRVRTLAMRMSANRASDELFDSLIARAFLGSLESAC